MKEQAADDDNSSQREYERPPTGPGQRTLVQCRFYSNDGGQDEKGYKR